MRWAPALTNTSSLKRARPLDSSAPPALTNAFVELNVGGRVYATNYQTLASSPPGLLSRLFAPSSAFAGSTVTDGDGRIFIERDADTFAAVLRYVTTGVALVPPGVARHRVVGELAYFFDTPPVAYTDGMCEALALPEIEALIEATQAMLAYFGSVIRQPRDKSGGGSTYVSLQRIPFEFVGGEKLVGPHLVAFTLHCRFSPPRLRPVTWTTAAVDELVNVQFRHPSHHRVDIRDIELAIAAALDAQCVRLVENPPHPHVDDETNSRPLSTLVCLFDERSAFVREHRDINFES